jgi:hypothetical protein
VAAVGVPSGPHRARNRWRARAGAELRRGPPLNKALAIMRSVAALVVCIACACSGEVREVCGGTSQKHYDEGLALHLSKAGVPYRRMEGGGLCAAEKYTAQFRAAEKELERYFPEIAFNPHGPCEEKVYLDWAARHSVRHDLVSAKGSDNRPAGKLFLLRPFTAEEYAAYQEKVRSDPPMLSPCKA